MEIMLGIMIGLASMFVGDSIKVHYDSIDTKSKVEVSTNATRYIIDRVKGEHYKDEFTFWVDHETGVRYVYNKKRKVIYPEKINR